MADVRRGAGGRHRQTASCSVLNPMFEGRLRAYPQPSLECQFAAGSSRNGLLTTEGPAIGETQNEQLRTHIDDDNRHPRSAGNSARANRSDLQLTGNSGYRIYARSADYFGSDGDRVAGAAKGAAAGAVVGEVQGDNSRGTDNMKDEHRENQAKSGAAAGMAVAGSRNRQERRGERRTSGDQQAAWQSSYDACVASK